MAPQSVTVEAIILTLCVSLFIAYHLFIFFIPPLFRRATFRVPAAARVARSRWLDAVAAAPRDSATQTYAVQSIRNSIMAASFAASTCGLIAVSGLLPAILDGAKIGRLRELAALDPITRALSRSSSETSGKSLWPSVEFKLSVMELVIISSFIAYMQCIRFNVYLTYSIKAIGTQESELYDSGEEETVFGREERAAEAAASAAAEAHALARRAGLCFTFGQRSFFAFLPLFLWLFGPTMLVVSTAMLLTGLYFTDVVTARGGGGGTGASAAKAAARAAAAARKWSSTGGGGGRGGEGTDVEASPQQQQKHKQKQQEQELSSMLPHDD